MQSKKDASMDLPPYETCEGLVYPIRGLTNVLESLLFLFLESFRKRIKDGSIYCSHKSIKFQTQETSQEEKHKAVQHIGLSKYTLNSFLFFSEDTRYY